MQKSIENWFTRQSWKSLKDLELVNCDIEDIEDRP